MSQLLRYRESLNLTQEQLSEKTNISVRTIQRIVGILSGSLAALFAAKKITLH